MKIADSEGKRNARLDLREKVFGAYVAKEPAQSITGGAGDTRAMWSVQCRFCGHKTEIPTRNLTRAPNKKCYSCKRS